MSGMYGLGYTTTNEDTGQCTHQVGSTIHQFVKWDKTHQDLLMLGDSRRSKRGKEVQVLFNCIPDEYNKLGVRRCVTKR